MSRSLCDCGAPAHYSDGSCEECAFLDYGGKPHPSRGAVIEALRDNPDGLTVVELNEHLAGKHNSVYQLLKKMVRAGRLVVYKEEFHNMRFPKRGIKYVNERNVYRLGDTRKGRSHVRQTHQHQHES